MPHLCEFSAGPKTRTVQGAFTARKPRDRSRLLPEIERLPIPAVANGASATPNVMFGRVLEPSVPASSGNSGLYPAACAVRLVGQASALRL